MYSLYRYYHISWLGGGQLKEYMEVLECFIESFQREGVDLVFFFDGSNVMFNVDGWIKRKRQAVNEVHDVLDKIEYGTSFNRIDANENKLVLPKNIWAVTIFLLKQKGCKVRLLNNSYDYIFHFLNFNESTAMYNFKLNKLIKILFKKACWFYFRSKLLLMNVTVNWLYLDEKITAWALLLQILI